MKKVAMLLLLVVAACSKPDPKNFNHDGVSFSLPGDWKIAEEQAIQEIGYYVSAQKDGITQSGLFTLTWVKGELDLAQNLKVYQDEMYSNTVYQSANLSFTPVKASKFAGRNTLSTDFSATILSVKHKGTLHCFQEKGTTYTVLIQEANEDADENREGFDTIEKTFAVK